MIDVRVIMVLYKEDFGDVARINMNMDLIEEALSVYKRDHGDDFTAFEFQALLDDIEQIRVEWECEA